MKEVYVERLSPSKLAHRRTRRAKISRNMSAAAIEDLNGREKKHNNYILNTRI